MLDWHLTKLMKLLERERAHLLRGDLAAAAELSDGKERLLEKLDISGLDAPRLRRLTTSASRNERLIAAAREGVSAARQRLQQIRQGPGVRTYMANGTRETIRPPQTSLHKRA